MKPSPLNSFMLGYMIGVVAVALASLALLLLAATVAPAAVDPCQIPHHCGRP